MEEKHYIQWIALHTEQGNQRKELKPGQEPKVTFAVAPGDQASGCLRILQPPRPVEGISTYRPLDNGGSFWL